MKVCAMSDLHGVLPEAPFITMPSCDVLVIAGDVAPDPFWKSVAGNVSLMREQQMEWFSSAYAEWESRIDAAHIVMTSGNHDWINELPSNCRTTLLNDSGTTINGKTFWGTPWVTPCGPWNFTTTRDRRRKYFEMIPCDLDVLIAHSPAYDVLDETKDGTHAGCRELYTQLYRARPRYMVHGHIHEGQRYGRKDTVGRTTVYNVARYGSTWQPLVFEI